MYSLLNHFFFTSILNIYAEPQLKWHLQYDNLHEDNTLLLLRPIPVRTIGKKCAISLARTWQHLGDDALSAIAPLSFSNIDTRLDIRGAHSDTKMAIYIQQLCPIIRHFRGSKGLIGGLLLAPL